MADSSADTHKTTTAFVTVEPRDAGWRGTLISVWRLDSLCESGPRGVVNALRVCTSVDIKPNLEKYSRALSAHSRLQLLLSMMPVGLKLRTSVAALLPRPSAVRKMNL